MTRAMGEGADDGCFAVTRAMGEAPVMEDLRRNPLIDEILHDHRAWSDGDEAGWAGYGNHAQRVFLFAQRLRGPLDDAGDIDERLAIAAAFHDLAVLRTVDYLGPNLDAARAWLTARGRSGWIREIGLAMTLHHRVRPYRGEAARLVEPIRRADWIECTGGLVTSGVPREVVRRAQRAFPMRRFAAGSAVRIAAHALTHPTDPLPFWRSGRVLAELDGRVEERRPRRRPR